MANMCEVCGAIESAEAEQQAEPAAEMSRDILHVCELCRNDRMQQE